MDEQLSRQVFVSRLRGGVLIFVDRTVDFVSASRLVFQVKENDLANKQVTDRD